MTYIVSSGALNSTHSLTARIDYVSVAALLPNKIGDAPKTTDGPQTAGLVMKPLHSVAEDVFIWTIGPKRGVNSYLLRFKNPITYLLI